MSRSVSRRSLLSTALALAPAAVAVALQPWAASAQGRRRSQGPATGAGDGDLRTMFDRLLAEHAALGAVALQKRYDGAPDAQAVANEVDKNSMAIADAVSQLYGAAAENQFLPLWRSHIQYYVQYTDALKRGDNAAMSQADQDLHSFASQLAGMMSGLNPYLDPAQVASGLTMHVEQTEDFIRSYASANYPTTYAGATDAVNHMFMMGGMLAAAVEAQFNAGGL